jgi:hypothetical protein
MEGSNRRLMWHGMCPFLHHPGTTIDLRERLTVALFSEP